jgi:hypothetical protein
MRAAIVKADGTSQVTVGAISKHEASALLAKQACACALRKRRCIRNHFFVCHASDIEGAVPFKAVGEFVNGEELFHFSRFHLATSHSNQ